MAADIAQKSLPSLSADDVLTTPYLMIGSAPELIERLLGQRERWGFTHYTLRRDALSQIEPVVAALVGR